VHELHSAQEDSSGKTGYVADHPAANRDNKRLAIGACAAKGAGDLFHAAEILCGFGVIEEMNGAASRKLQAAPDRFSHGAPDFRRGNDVHT